MLAIFIFLVLFSAPVSGEERFIEIRAKKFEYTPSQIRVNKGDRVKIRLISEDVHHGFFLDGYEVSASAHPGQDGTLSFTADKGGRFSFRCSVTCGDFHPYMIGYLVVEKNTRFYFFAGIIIVIFLLNIFLLSKRKEIIQTNAGQ